DGHHRRYRPALRCAASRAEPGDNDDNDAGARLSRRVAIPAAGSSVQRSLASSCEFIGSKTERCAVLPSTPDEGMSPVRLETAALLFLECIAEVHTRQAFGSIPESAGLTNEGRMMRGGDLSPSIRVISGHHQTSLARRQGVVPMISPIRTWNTRFHSMTQVKPVRPRWEIFLRSSIRTPHLGWTNTCHLQ
ncbi:unnamed protein product, partial [Laminaria digitata]